jgi:hypothetical protein
VSGLDGGTIDVLKSSLFRAFKPDEAAASNLAEFGHAKLSSVRWQYIFLLETAREDVASAIRQETEVPMFNERLYLYQIIIEEKHCSIRKILNEQWHLVLSLINRGSSLLQVAADIERLTSDGKPIAGNSRDGTGNETNASTDEEVCFKHRISRATNQKPL